MYDVLWAKLESGEEIRQLVTDALMRVGYELEEGKYMDLPAKKIAEALK